MSPRDSQPSVPDDFLTLHDLPDHVLSLCLQRLSPDSGVLIYISPAGHKFRQAFLRDAYAGAAWAHSSRDQAAERAPPDERQLPPASSGPAWRECFRDTHATAAPLPPWARGAAADAAYGAAVSDPCPALRVCKRWRSLMPPSVTISLCGLGEKPPTSTDVLVLADTALWLQHKPVGSRHYDGEVAGLATGLTKLRALLMWGVHGDRGRWRFPPHTVWTAPAPPLLNDLQHLLYVGVPGVERVRVHQRTLEGITALTQLKTLSLPLCHPLDVRNMAWLLRDMDLSQLRMFSTPNGPHVFSSPPLSVGSTSLQTLRTLRVELGERWPSGDPLEHGLVDVSQASCPALERFHLFHYGPLLPLWQVTGLSTLTRLTHLELLHVRSRDLASELEGLTAMAFLRLQGSSLHDFAPTSAIRERLLQVLQPLTLSLRLDWCRDMSELAGLTGLVELEVSMAKAPVDTDQHHANRLGMLRGLTRLSALALRGCCIRGEDCEALARLSLLQKLQLRECEGMLCLDHAMLRPLTALQLLELSDVRDEAGTWFAQLQVPRACRGLKVLKLTGHHAILNTTMDEITQLRKLEDLDLSWTHVTDSHLPQLACLPQLRSLSLHGCRFVTARGLGQLTACDSLLCVHARGVYISEEQPEISALRRKGAAVLLRYD